MKHIIYRHGQAVLIINCVVAMMLLAFGQLDTYGFMNHLLVEGIAASILVTNHLDTFRHQEINEHFKQKLKWLNNKEKKLTKLTELEDEIKTVEGSHDYLNELITLS